MKIRITLVLAIAAMVAADEEKKPRPDQQLAALKWMAGGWSGEMWGGVFHAYYSTAEGGKMLSYSYLMKGERRALYEFEKFDVQKDKVVYIPFPGGKRAAHFLLIEAGETRAVFENPKKDYPTRIEFERTGDKLSIRLSDPHGKSPKKEVFRLTRTP